MTVARPFTGLLSKLPPNCYQYPEKSIRRFQRHGLQFELDISDLIPWYLYFGFVDPSHDALIGLCRPGDVVLDIGANIGVTALRMARAVRPSGWVFGFEPDEENFGVAQAHRELNRVVNLELFPIGMADVEGELPLKRVDRSNRGMHRVDRSGGDTVMRMSTIDQFVSERSLEAIDLIKIDVEGFEVDVLAGARRTLERFRPRLFVELDDALLRLQGKSASDLVDRLASLGYSVHSADVKTPIDPTHLDGIHVDIICRPT